VGVISTNSFNEKRLSKRFNLQKTVIFLSYTRSLFENKEAQRTKWKITEKQIKEVKIMNQKGRYFTFQCHFFIFELLQLLGRKQGQLNIYKKSDARQNLDG